MAVLYRFFLGFLCLLLLAGSHVACSQQQEAKPEQKNIDWHKAAEQLKTLEQKRKETLDTFQKKAQARSTSNPKPAPIENTRR
jgi:hypothetical protein